MTFRNTMKYGCKIILNNVYLTGSWQRLFIMRKKIDNRIRVMIENGVVNKHRSLFVVVGDKAKDQVILCKTLPFYLYKKCTI